MKIYRYLSIFGVLFVLYTPFVSARNNAPTDDVKPAKWPVESRPKLEGEVKKVLFDGMHFDKLFLKTKEFTWEMEPFQGWVQDRTQRDESFALKLRVAPVNRVSFILFKRGEFLDDFEPSTLKSYVKYLEQKYPGRISFLNEKDNFRIENTFFILDSPYRIFDYLVKNSKGGETRFRDYILFPQGQKNPYTLIVRQEGPSEAVEKQMKWVNYSLQHAVQVKE